MVGALPPALAELGEEVAVVVPRYRSVSLDGAHRVATALPLWVGPGLYHADIFEVERRGARYFLVDCPPFFDREGIYSANGVDYWDNFSRFAGLCHAALGLARYLFRPRVIHCHDWQAALLPVYLNQFYAGDPTFLGVRTVLTIHNLGYQGRYSRDRLWWLGLSETLFHPDYLEFYGDINILKGGLVFSDFLTTVSPTYAREILTPEQGFGLDGLLRARSSHLRGILNGIDCEEWNPETDRFLPAHYSSTDLEGKRTCKLHLLREMGLPLERPEVPLIGIVSRLVAQKGFDLIAQVAGDLPHWDIRMVVLGSGEGRYEDLFRSLAAAHPHKFAVRIEYDEGLAHRIEAGADIFLMPSHYEPCGLNQMYSLRYGAVPVVHATGGLDDTIDSETGFKFRPYSVDAMLGALREALRVYATEPSRWQSMMREGMRRDFSWRASARAYRDMYRSIAV